MKFKVQIFSWNIFELYKHKLFLDKDDDANGARLSLPLFLIIILRLFDAMKTSHSPQLCLINWSNEDILFLTIEHFMIGTCWKCLGIIFIRKKKDVSQCFEAESIIAEISLTWFIVSENWTKFGPLPVDNQFGELM